MTAELGDDDTLLPVRRLVLVCTLCSQEHTVNFDPPLETIDAFIRWTKEKLVRWHDCPSDKCDIKIPVNKVS